MVDDRNSTPARSPESGSPPPAVLPARVAALKNPTTVQRRRSLPARMNGAGDGLETKRKRQTTTKSRSPPKRTIPNTKTISTSFSDSDSDPLSELSSEPESESEDEQSLTQPSTPASPASTVASASTTTPSVRKIILNVTSKRTSTRLIPPRKPPTRTSARLSHVVAPDPAPVDEPMDVEVSSSLPIQGLTYGERADTTTTDEPE